MYVEVIRIAGWILRLKGDALSSVLVPNNYQSDGSEKLRTVLVILWLPPASNGNGWRAARVFFPSWVHRLGNWCTFSFCYFRQYFAWSVAFPMLYPRTQSQKMPNRRKDTQLYLWLLFKFTTRSGSLKNVYLKISCLGLSLTMSFVYHCSSARSRNWKCVLNNTTTNPNWICFNEKALMQAH